MGAVLLPRHLCAMCVCAHVCMRQGKQDRVFSCTDLHLCCACLCMCLIAAMIVYAKSAFPAYEHMCVCVLVHRCHRVVTLPVTRTFGVQIWGEDSQRIGKAMRYNPQGVLCFSDPRTPRYTTVCVFLGSERCSCHFHCLIFEILHTCVCVCFLSHTDTSFVSMFRTWSWMMSYAAAAWLTDSFRTTTWGPMVSLSGRLTGEWHQWEPAVPPPRSQALSDSQ